MQNIRGLHKKRTDRKKERVLLPERIHKQVLTVKKNMHLILNGSTGTLQVVTVALSIAPDRGFHCKCMQTKPAHIPNYMLREVKV